MKVAVIMAIWAGGSTIAAFFVAAFMKAGKGPEIQPPSKESEAALDNNSHLT